MSAAISYASLQQLHDFYLQGAHKLSTAAIGKEDTKSVWFELNDDFRKFLSSVLEPKNAVTGIKMYLLQNPDSQRDVAGAELPAKVEDINQLCVGLVATTLENGRQVDIQKTIEPMNHSSLCPSFCF